MAEQMADELIFFNGIDGSNGRYLIAPMSLQNLSALVQQQHVGQEPLAVLRRRKERDTEAHLGLVDIIEDPQDLSQAGWGVIFPAELPQAELDALKAALKPLLDHRQSQAGERYREYVGPNGYRTGDTIIDWLPRHGRSPAEQADPDVLPYYLLLVGGPEQIPYTFQYHLDVVYGVGRLFFEQQSGESMGQRLVRYARYAESIVATEQSPPFRARQAAFFGVANPDDRATQLSAQYLVDPLQLQIVQRRQDWQTTVVTHDAATKDRLSSLLNGADAPSLLFTASHGMGFRLGDDKLERHQGALLCGDWPGPEEWMGRGPIPDSYYFSADDLSNEARLHGMIAFHFACFGAGTPKFDDFGHRVGGSKQIAQRSMIARLPQELLSHPKGGAVAVLGHVDRAWGYSFSWRDLASQTDSFRDTLMRIMRGDRLGWATEVLGGRYATLSTSLSAMLADIRLGRIPDDANLTSVWTANNDARGYVILGDPAARLALPIQSEQPQSPPMVNFAIQAASRVAAEPSQAAATTPTTDTSRLQTTDTQQQDGPVQEQEESDEGGPTMLTLVLTHGRDKPFEIPDTLQREWIDALRFGLRRARAGYADTILTSFAFYGDLWRGDIDFALSEEPDADPLQVAIAQDMLRASGAPNDDEASYGINLEPFRKVLVALDKYTGAGELFLRRITRDTAQYFRDQALREATMKRVAEKVIATGERVVLLAHSMGTIVSYDLLMSQPELPVDTLITFGSPLGLSTIRKRVAGVNGRTAFPPQLRRWINVSNSEDPVALVRNLAPLYPSTDGREVEDVDAISRNAKPTQIMSGHDPIIYLSSMGLARKLRDVVESSKTA
ncbi:MAG TPA: hypothetical protein VJ183_11185 [Chloroflexia bacterium]|nr:hypothetical protein [Chloroflexia bacterium]